MKSKKLRELTKDDIAHFAFSAISTWGTVNDFKHFLPRIFELIATLPDDFPIETQVAVGKLAYAGWKTWPEIERTAIHAYLRAWWESTLWRPVSDGLCTEADDVLCSIGNVVEDVRSHLKLWAARTDLDASFHLAAFVDWNFDSLYRKNRLVNAFWNCETATQQVETWLRESARREKLEELYLKNSEHPLAYRLSEAAQQLEWWTSKAT